MFKSVKKQNTTKQNKKTKQKKKTNEIYTKTCFTVRKLYTTPLKTPKSTYFRQI